MYALLIWSACVDDDGADVAATSESDPGEALTWAGEGLRVEVAEAPQNPLAALVTVEVDRPATVELRWDCGGRTGAQTRSFPADGAPLMEIWGVPEQTRCDVQLDATDVTGDTQRVSGLTWVSGGAPEDLPETSAAPGGAPGITLVSPVLGPDKQDAEFYVYGVDGDGAIVWLYMYAGEPNLDRCVRDMGDGTMAVLLEHSLRRITPGGQTISEVGNADMGLSHHDALPLPGGDALFLISESRIVDVPALGEVPVEGDRLVRVAGGAGGAAAGAIVWEWSAFDHLDTWRFPGELSRKEGKNDEGLDWTHGNGLALSPDGNSVLYSARNQSLIVNISLDTGEVGWILGDGGDFALDPAGAGGGAAGWFYNQHAPELLADGSVLLYDNGNERPGADTDPLYSRAVRYALDMDTMTAAEVWSWTTPAYTYRMGDANLLQDGNYLINVGSPEHADAQVFEVSPDGDPVWTLTVVEDDMYRAERMEP